MSCRGTSCWRSPIIVAPKASCRWLLDSKGHAAEFVGIPCRRSGKLCLRRSPDKKLHGREGRPSSAHSRFDSSGSASWFLQRRMIRRVHGTAANRGPKENETHHIATN